MKSSKTVLGKGLGALIKESSTISGIEVTPKPHELHSETLAKIPVDLIEPNPYQPRIEFDESTLEELKESIKEKGVIQPITVRRLENKRFQLISGERRLRAAIMAELDMIPAYIIRVDTKEEMIELSLIENIQRDTLNPIEIALGFKRLMEECHLSQDDIAKKTSKDRSTVANFIRLLKLPEEIQKSLIKNEITTGHARALINIDDTEEQLKIWRKIVEEKSSVRVVEKLAKQKKKVKKTSVTIYNIEPNLESIISKLRILFGTKVNVKQRSDGSGDIIIEYYSLSEFERIIEILNEKSSVIS